MWLEDLDTTIGEEGLLSWTMRMVDDVGDDEKVSSTSDGVAMEGLFELSTDDVEDEDVELDFSVVGTELGVPKVLLSEVEVMEDEDADFVVGLLWIMEEAEGDEDENDDEREYEGDGEYTGLAVELELEKELEDVLTSIEEEVVVVVVIVLVDGFATTDETDGEYSYKVVGS